MSWENFLENEKLYADRLDGDIDRLVLLCEKLASIRPPKIKPHKAKLESRRLVAETAIDMGFDLTQLKYKGRPAMGRGLLDVWNVVYKERFGTNYGTSGAKEVIRRNIKLKK